MIQNLRNYKDQQKIDEDKSPTFANQVPAGELIIPVKSKSLVHSSKGAISIHSSTGIVTSTTRGDLEASSVIEKKID